MINPSDIINSYNFNGLLSLPPLPSIYTGTPPFVDNCPNCPQAQTVNDATLPQGSLDPNATGAPQTSKQITDALGITGWFDSYIKYSALILLALILLALGLYMLTVSTEVGRNTIAAGLKAAAA